LAAFVAFACVVVSRTTWPDHPSTPVQYFALGPLAMVLAALTYRLNAGTDDFLQRIVAAALALLGLCAFVTGLLLYFEWSPSNPEGWGPLVLAVVPGGWSLLAAAAIPVRLPPTGRLDWWRALLVLFLAGVVPVAAALVNADMEGAFAAAAFTSAPAFVLASAWSGAPAWIVLGAACLGTAVGLSIDLVRGGSQWAAEFALLYALGGAAAHLASQAAGLTAVRRLDGAPVRLRPIVSWSTVVHVLTKPIALRDVGAAVSAAVVVALPTWALWGLGEAFVARSDRRPETPLAGRRREVVDQIGGGLEWIPATTGKAVTRPACGAVGDVRLEAPDANAGAEALLAFFAANDMKFVVNLEGGRQVSTCDADADGRREYLDWWGNPIVYIDSADYAAAAGGVAYVRSDGRRLVVKPFVDPDTGKWYRQFTFQLFSIGPDELPNTDDDVHYARW
jgi:hypothetical protein